MKFFYGYINNYVDVTEKVLKLDNGNGEITINKLYNTLLGDPYPWKLKHLKIESNDIGSIAIKEDVPFTFSVKPLDVSKIFVVYFINTQYNPNYIHLLRSQLNELKQSGLLDYAELYVEACTSVDSCNDDTIIQGIKQCIPNANIQIYHDDTHEYHGIYKVWSLARSNPNSYILYFHSKGITRINPMTETNCRTSQEKVIFNHVINQWQRNINLLKRFKSIDKLGFSCSNSGLIWYNYFWAKSEYLCKCEEPIETSDRYYYEEWLARCLKEPKSDNKLLPLSNEHYILNYYNCINLIGDYNIGIYYDNKVNKWFY